MNANMSGLGGSNDDMDTTPQVDETAQPQPSQETDSSSAQPQAELEPTSSEADATGVAGETPEDQPADSAGEVLADETESAAEEATAEAQQDAVPDAQTEPQAAAAESGDTGGLKRNMLIEGTVAATSPTQVTVDIGADVPGIISSAELEKMSKGMLESLREGEKVWVFVVNPRTADGTALLSVNRALEELDWKRAEEYRQSQQVFETHIAGYNKGGLIVRFGRVRGFVPQSQMSADRRRVAAGETPEERWGKMVNEPISVKVMEVDRARNRLILSERSASRESREKRKEALISQLKVGEVRTGRVVSLEDFGAFVDVGGAEGLVHLTELSWKHVTKPSDILQVGQEVRVQVISIDREHKRIGLSMKRQESDPWDMVAINFNEGQLVQGIVTKLTKFGAFARLVDLPEIEGLIHISELSDRRVNHPKEVVDEGDKLTLRVVKINIADRRLGLSLKKVNSAEYLDQDWANFSYGDTTSTETEPEAPAAEEPSDEAPATDDAATEAQADVDEMPADSVEASADEAAAEPQVSVDETPVDSADASADAEDEAPPVEEVTGDENGE